MQRAAETLLAAFSIPTRLEGYAAQLAQIERDGRAATDTLYEVLAGRIGLRFERDDYLLISTQLEKTVTSFGRVARWAVACELSAFERTPCELARALCGLVRVVRDMLQRIEKPRQVLQYSEFVDLFAENFRVDHSLAIARTLGARSDPIAAIRGQGLYDRLNVVLGNTMACARAIERVSLKHA